LKKEKLNFEEHLQSKVSEMSTIKELKPTEVMKYFDEILQIPRASKKEEKILRFLIDFAKHHQLLYKQDKAGNLLISKPASRGKEKTKTVVLQSHVDMVCEKNSDIKHDFDKDPIHAYVDGEWVKARGTTLGADDGIGIAAQLAVLASNEIEHGPVECLFTVDEETGLTGAFALQKGFFEGKILINLDSEDEGELFIGCAGGTDTVASFQFKKEKPGKNDISFKVAVSGLTGGHSGDDIHKGLGNSNKILNRFLWNLNQKSSLRLVSFDGGNLRNAIPREAYAVFTIDEDKIVEMGDLFQTYSKDIKREFFMTEPGLNLSLEKVDLPDYVIDINTQSALLNSLYACPHGVVAWSQTIPGLVETSTNLASVKLKGNQIEVSTSQRSSIESAKWDIACMVEATFLLAGARVTHGKGYPGWAPDKNSEILKITESSYKKLFHTKPIVRAIHAGLECGLFLEKYPDLDMISFGPTIKGAHSPDERLHIESNVKFWELLIEVLREIPEY
jgi:dipeptidase D